MAIEYRNLGNTGLKVAPICMGCMMFGSRTEEPESAMIIQDALDNGWNFFDTANVYSKQKSEEILGRAVKGKRDQAVIATKVHGKMGDGPNDKGNSRRHIFQQVDASLRRLGTDYIDLYQLHRPDPTTPLEETLSALNDLIHAGKIRYYGFSHFESWQHCKALWIAEKNGWEPVVSEQCRYSILQRGVENEVAPFCGDHGIGLLPHSVLMYGLLTGKYRRGQDPPADSRAGREGGGLKQYFTDAMFDVLETLEARATDLGKTLSQYAIAWSLANPAVVAPIVGPRTHEQWIDNIGGYGWEFPQEEIDFVNKLTDGINTPIPIKRYMYP